MVPGVQFSVCLRVRGERPGCHLTTLFETNTATSVPAIDTPSAPKRHGWLPLLTILFLISYGLMTMLIVEQGQTIESQRALIRELFRDSSELSAMKKMQAEQQDVNSVQTQVPATQAPVNQAPVTQNPSSRTQSQRYPSAQYPSTQAPTSQSPSSQAGPQQRRTQSQSAKQKPDFKMPSKPTPELVDDVRTLTTI